MLKTWNEKENEPLTNYLENKNFVQKIFSTDIDPQSDFITTLRNFNERTSRLQLTKLIDGIGIYDTYETELTSDKSVRFTKYNKFLQSTKESQTDLAIEWCKTYKVPLRNAISLD